MKITRQRLDQALLEEPHAFEEFLDTLVDYANEGRDSRSQICMEQWIKIHAKLFEALELVHSFPRD